LTVSTVAAASACADTTVICAPALAGANARNASTIAAAPECRLPERSVFMGDLPCLDE